MKNVEVVRGASKIRLFGASEQWPRSFLSCCTRCKLGLNASLRVGSAAASGRHERWLDPSSDLPYPSPPPASSAPPRNLARCTVCLAAGAWWAGSAGPAAGSTHGWAGRARGARARLAGSWARAEHEASPLALCPSRPAPWALKASSADLDGFGMGCQRAGSGVS